MIQLIRLGWLSLAALIAANASALPVTASAGSDFTVVYDAIGGDPAAPVNGLSAQVRFREFEFIDTGAGKTDVTFKFDIFNTSTAPVTASRISTLGFNTTPDVDASSSTDGLTGIFDTIAFAGNVPNQGTLEFCFSDVNCAGGGSTGVSQGASSLGNMATISFLADLTSIQFDMFTVRYQSVECERSFTGNCPGSASGSGQIPEPGTLALFGAGLLGLSLARRSRRA